jgi:hypothetical protein
MSKVGIELSVDTNKLQNFLEEMCLVGKKYGIEPLIVNDNHLYFNLDELVEIKSKGVINP